MFGMGFTEILFIAVVAILFLGPDKLPEAMVQIAKFFKSVRNTVNEAKSSFEEEVRIKELREEALNYRRQIEEASSDIAGFKNAIPNPATEIQEAIASVGGGAPGIGGERYLDEDILADLEEAEQASAEPTDTAEPSEPTTEPAPEPNNGPKEKSQKRADKETGGFKHLDGKEPA